MRFLDELAADQLDSVLNGGSVLVAETEDIHVHAHVNKRGNNASKTAVAGEDAAIHGLNDLPTLSPPAPKQGSLEHVADANLNSGSLRKTHANISIPNLQKHHFVLVPDLVLTGRTFDEFPRNAADMVAWHWIGQILSHDVSRRGLHRTAQTRAKITQNSFTFD